MFFPFSVTTENGDGERSAAHVCVLCVRVRVYACLFVFVCACVRVLVCVCASVRVIAGVAV